MFLGGVVCWIRPAFVVEIVQQRSDAPKIFVRAQLSGVSTHAGFYGQRVFAEAFTLRVLAQKVPRLVPIWHFAPLWSLPHSRMAPPEAVTAHQGPTKYPGRANPGSNCSTR